MNTPTTGPSGRTLIIAGVAFALLGVAAIAVPATASIAIEQFVAGLLLFWGAAGIGLGLSLRPAPEWRITTAIFTGILALGGIFLLYPADGVQTMTMLLVALFLLEGVASTVMALSLRQSLPNWSMMLLSGLAAIVVGLLIMANWPLSATWTLGLMAGLNFLSTGVALAAIGLSLTKDRP